MRYLFLTFFVSILFSGCTNRLFDFSIMSTKNVSIDDFKSYNKKANNVKGEDMTHIIIFIPTKTINVSDAVDNTIDKIPGWVALLDGAVYSKWWWIPYIYGESKYVVEATPLVNPEETSATKKIPNYSKVNFNKDGEIENMKTISKNEYKSSKNKIIKNGDLTRFKDSRK